MELGIFFSGLDLDKDLIKPAVIKEVHSALLKSYDLFETGLCEMAHMCNKCEAKRELMGELVILMAQCEKEEMVSNEAHEALVEFIHIIPATLLEMKNLYLQSLSEGEA